MLALLCSFHRPNASYETLHTSLQFLGKPFYNDGKFYLAHSHLALRSFCLVLGAFFPIFFLQLNAITRGLSPDFAFDTVRILGSLTVRE